MTQVKLTAAQALVRYLAAQRVEVAGADQADANLFHMLSQIPKIER